MTGAADSPTRSMAVLIVAYRSADKLARCIESVQRYLPDLEVHVWDNSGPECSDVRDLASSMPHAHWYLHGRTSGLQPRSTIWREWFPAKTSFS